MAIVRRHQIAVGRAAVPVPTVYTSAPPIPTQAGPVDGGFTAGAPSGAHAAGTPRSAPPTAAPADAASLADPAAAAVPTLPAHPLAVIAGLGLAVWGGLAAMGVNNMLAPPVFRVDNQMSAFGALFAAAAAVERVLEPFTRWMPGRKSMQKYEQAMADLANGVPGATHVAATAKAQVERDRSSRGVIMWGLATAVATIISSAGGFYLLHVLSADSQWDAVPRWVDALITGLVVGSGTKPLHDLVTRAQKKANKDNGD
jgi:hypothetical protein